MIVPAFAPWVLLAAALFAATRPGRRPQGVAVVAEVSALVALALAALGLAQAWATGPQAAILGTGAFALGLRLDTLSGVTSLLVAFVGWVVVRYSRSYLDGADREGRFHALMLAALAASLFLVQAGTLAALVLSFVATGLVLRHLLLFYPERPQARRAAAKFSLVWSAGDVALLIAAILLAAAFGTGQIDAIRAAATAQELPVTARVAIGFLVLAACLKTAAFPLNGWLTEVMEAPTPVSALLHAGIINAGGVLLILFAPLVQASPGALAALVMIGGLTALFGAMVMLTQSAVKTALAWSTVAQMGFMLLQCGLGLWALALLHIVAHSLYKAHAFLSSGGEIDRVTATRRPGPVAVPGIGAVVRAFVLALGLYALVAAAFALVVGAKSPQSLALGAILVFGVAYLVAQGLADAAPGALTKRTLAASAATTVAYFAFHSLATAVAGSAVPAPPQAGALEWALIVLSVVSFGAVAVAQALFPHWAHHPATAGLRVHVANGFYVNALFDRVIGGHRAGRAF